MARIKNGGFLKLNSWLNCVGISIEISPVMALIRIFGLTK